LPPATNTYTVISHQYAIDTITKALGANNFKIESEQYKSTAEAKVASGTFIITYGDDPDLAMSYSFSNSYDKSRRFKAAVGALVRTNNSFMVSNMDFWRRKHTGTADTETEDLIKEHILNAKDYFEELKSHKQAMQGIEIDKGTFGAIIGQLFIDGYLTVDQFSMAAKEYANPSHVYTTGPNNLWTCYNHIIYALKNTHPAKWLQCQAAVHLFFVAKYDLAHFDDDEETLDEDLLEDTDDIQDNTEEQEEESSEETSEEEVESAEESADNNVTVVYEKDTDPTYIAAVDPAVEETTEESVVLPVALPITQNTLPDPASSEEYPKEWDGEPEETVAETTDVPEDTTQSTYVEASDYEGIEEGDAIDVDGEYFEVKTKVTMEGEEYLELVPISIEAGVEKVRDLLNTEVEEHSVEVTEQVSEEESFEDEIEAKEEPVIDDTLSFEIEEDKEESVTEEQSDNSDTECREDVGNVGEEFKGDPAIMAVIDREIEELYGEKRTFKYEEVSNGQFNVTLDTGETMVLSGKHIRSEM
jgi:hypothetical protein